MRRQIAAALCSAALGVIAVSSLDKRPQRLAWMNGKPTKPQIRPMESPKGVTWLDVALAPAKLLGIAKSTPPSKTLWNPSSIHLRTHFGERQEQLSINKVF